MAFDSKETAYKPLESEEAEFSPTSKSTKCEDDKAMLLGQFPRRNSRFGSWARASGIALAIINTILLVSIIGVVSINRHKTQCSEIECAAKNSYYCKSVDNL